MCLQSVLSCLASDYPRGLPGVLVCMKTPAPAAETAHSAHSASTVTIAPEQTPAPRNTHDAAFIIINNKALPRDRQVHACTSDGLARARSKATAAVSPRLIALAPAFCSADSCAGAQSTRRRTSARHVQLALLVEKDPGVVVRVRRAAAAIWALQVREPRFRRPVAVARLVFCDAAREQIRFRHLCDLVQQSRSR